MVTKRTGFTALVRFGGLNQATKWAPSFSSSAAQYTLKTSVVLRKVVLMAYLVYYVNLDTLENNGSTNVGRLPCAREMQTTPGEDLPADTTKTPTRGRVEGSCTRQFSHGSSYTALTLIIETSWIAPCRPNASSFMAQS